MVSFFSEAHHCLGIPYWNFGASHQHAGVAFAVLALSILDAFLPSHLWYGELAGSDKCVLHSRLTKRSIVSIAEFNSVHWDSSPCCAYNGISFSSHANRNICFCVEICGGETKQNTVFGEKWSNTLMDVRWGGYLALLWSFITLHGFLLCPLYHSD